MANNYTAIPNIIAGNLKVVGTLTVQGDTLQVGAQSPYVRLIKQFPGNGGMTVNLQHDGATRDDPSLFGWGINFGCQWPGSMEVSHETPAGVLTQTACPLVVFSDSTAHNGSGAGGDLAIISRVIRGNTIGPNGMFMLRTWGSIITAASGGVTFNGSFGGVNFPVATVGPSLNSNCAVMFFITNVNATNAQRLATVAAGTNVASSVLASVGAIDTTVDQTLSLSLHFTQPGDNAYMFGVEGVLLNSFGPM